MKRRVRPQHGGRLVVPLMGLAVGLAALAGCGSSGGVDRALVATACTAIPKVQSKLAHAKDLSETDLNKLQTATKKASSAISTVQAELPDGAASQVANATVQFNAAVDADRLGPNGSPDAVERAAVKLHAELAQVAVDLKC